ncbi:MAG: hypothetical protein J3Q66DRAFT_403218 [Benniella sp.]|nr:MAG: hypothetical protein J3Q66DRAFT_403218 [Benniella sp.]
MGVLPVLIIALAVIQWSIGLLVIMVNHTRVGAHYYEKFFADQIALFDETDFVDPEGNDEAVRQLVDRTPRQRTHFSYHIANILLIMSSMVYQRDDKLVAKAFKIMVDCQNQEQRDHAARLLQTSEQMIDDNASKEFGMRFMGISELKTLGGPFAGLFYNDDAIVLVFKGTSVLAFNEYLLDVTIQRVDASEYLYGEIHKGFYESLFPDPIPLNWYENMTYDQTNPFNTIMETIFEVAQVGKRRTGKPVNLWLTGHSLGAALAAMVMARLQMQVKEDDPLMNKDFKEKKDNKANGNTTTNEKHSSSNADQGSGPKTVGPRTVLEEMLARFSDDPELLILRDCYTVASPKVGDSTFADEFARNHVHYCAQSPYKPTYWRIAADMDVVPHLPPGFSVDSNIPWNRFLPPGYWPNIKGWLEDAKRQDQKKQKKQKDNDDEKKTRPVKHLNSLLDYQHIGQLVKVCNASKVPTIRPSGFEADLSEGILRGKNGLAKLMTKLGQMATTWQVQDHIVDSVQQSSSVSNTEGTATTRTTVTTTATMSVPACDEQQTRAATAQQIADDIAKAQALYDVDELERLRQPRLVERILLKIPSFLSHAPAAYQRNLVRGRFHFKSFPGTEFEERLDRWLEQTQWQASTVDEGVDVASSDGEHTQERSTGELDSLLDVDIDIGVQVTMGKNKRVSSYTQEKKFNKTERVMATMTHTVSLMEHEP